MLSKINGITAGSSALPLFLVLSKLQTKNIHNEITFAKHIDLSTDFGKIFLNAILRLYHFPLISYTC